MSRVARSQRRVPSPGGGIVGGRAKRRTQRQPPYWSSSVKSTGDSGKAKKTTYRRVATESAPSAVWVRQELPHTKSKADKPYSELILEFWESRWGELNDEFRQSFRAKDELTTIKKYGVAEIRKAINLHQPLKDIAAFLEDNAGR